MVRSSGGSPQLSFHPLCDVWLGIASVYHQFLLMPRLANSAYLLANMINIILTHSLLPPLAFHYWGILLVRVPALFVLIREIKPGFVQHNKMFSTLLLDGTQQIQRFFDVVTEVCFWASESM
jgi:hypothetical protein